METMQSQYNNCYGNKGMPSNTKKGKPIMMKTCTKCGANKELSEFGLCRANKDGLKGWCKECCREYRKGYQQTIAGKEAIRKGNQRRNRKYEQSDARKESRRKYSQTDKGKEANRKRDRKHCLLHPEKIKARNAVSNALKTGRLTRPNHCESCYCEGFIESHHESYEEEKWLDVEWLYKECHTNKGSIL